MLLSAASAVLIPNINMTYGNGELLRCPAQNTPHRTLVRLVQFYLDASNYTRLRKSYGRFFAPFTVAPASYQSYDHIQSLKMWGEWT